MVGALVIIVVLGTLFGAIGGWIIGLFFEQEIMEVLAALGVSTQNLSMWELGAFLGFLGGFFRTPNYNKK